MLTLSLFSLSLSFYSPYLYSLTPKAIAPKKEKKRKQFVPTNFLS